jgi:hypothetical protein
VATRIDRRLPKPLRTFAALYGSWLEKMRHGREAEHAFHGRRRRLRMMMIDLALVLLVLIGASVWRIEIRSSSPSSLSPAFSVSPSFGEHGGWCFL